MSSDDAARPTRDINAVLADHDKQLMSIPNVVGVYVGLLDDQKTSCMRVMLAADNPTSRRAIPRTIEGYRVVTEITGPISPMGR